MPNENVNLAEVDDTVRKEFVGFGTLIMAFGQIAIGKKDRDHNAKWVGDGELTNGREDLPFKIYVEGTPGFGIFAVLFGKRAEAEVKARNWINKTLEAKGREYNCRLSYMGYNPSII